MATTAGRLSRYRGIVRMLMKYSRTDFPTPGVVEPPADGAATAAEADAFVCDLEALGPTFIKLGQVMSTRPDLLPPAYIRALSRLQDDVQPFPFSEVERIVQRELHVRMSKAFASFDPEPVAAASLGQVHRATLRSGREVAVKVQRPGIREQVLADLDTLDRVAGLIDRFGGRRRNVDARRTLDEFRRTLLAELDYRQEAQHLLTMHAQLRGFERIVVPLPVEDYTTTRVLTMDFICGTKVTNVSPVEWTEAHGGDLAEELFHAYLQQILVDGTFHADPHPGNVLLTPDRKLALIDLGMIGHLTPTLQERLFRLVLAISEGRGDEAATVVIELGERRDDFDEAAVRREVTALVAKFEESSVKDLNVGLAMLDITGGCAAHGLKVSPETALLGKTLLNLDEVGRRLDPSFDPSAAIRRTAPVLMQQRMGKSVSPASIAASLLEMKEFAARLPGRVNRILDAIAGNDLRLKVEVIDRGAILEGLQKVANRIALGLVLAALIVGAAMLMQVRTAFTLFGYPGLAILLFFAAAGGGMWMAWTIIASDVRARH